MGIVKKLRVGSSKKYSKKFENVKKWIEVHQDFKEVRFLIKPFYNMLKKGQFSVLNNKGESKNAS